MAILVDAILLDPNVVLYVSLIDFLHDPVCTSVEHVLNNKLTLLKLKASFQT
jgi:hypothetical protein